MLIFCLYRSTATKVSYVLARGLFVTTIFCHTVYGPDSGLATERPREKTKETSTAVLRYKQNIQNISVIYLPLNDILQENWLRWLI